MAIIQNPTDLANPINYVATLAFFCCVSCAVLMLKFRGFKASLNLSSWRKKDAEIAPTLSMTGAYRVNRSEFIGNGSVYDPPKKLTPSMVKLPPSFDPEPGLRPTKSTSDLTRPPNIPPQLKQHQSTHNISLDPRGGSSKNGNTDRNPAQPTPARPERKKKDENKLSKEQKKLEKQKLAEERAREKAAAQEQARQQKLQREREKQAAQEQAKLLKRNKKKAPTPQPQTANPLSRNAPPPPPPIPPPAPSYSTNTLESSISRSSGPPPYSETSKIEATSGGNSNPGNVSFSKPIDNTPDSWDLISQHRQQINRPVSAGIPKGPRKNMVMDLQYKLGQPEDKGNSEA